MTITSPTLSEMEAHLAHAVAEDRASGSGEKSDKKGRSKGKFDESKVKRDGDGMFAKKDSGKEMTDAEMKKIDGLWETQDNLESLQAQLLSDAIPEMDKLMMDAAKKYGISGSPDEVENAIRKPENKAVLAELAEQGNKILESRSGRDYVSPSGKQRLSVTLGTANNDLTIKATKVSYSGPNPHPDVTASLLSAQRDSARIARADRKDTTPMFNPTAKLDTSRVSDASDGEEPKVSAAKSMLEKLKSIFHADLVMIDGAYFLNDDYSPTLSQMIDFLDTSDAVLEHYGIKGMKWGIRRSDRELAALHDEDGERIGGINARTRKDAQTLKRLGVGRAVVIESDEGPMAVVKTKDGSFKKVHISADAQAAVRTLNKEEIERSTREMKEAAARAKAIEDYNKYFGNTDKPNAELQAAVDRLELEQKYSAAYAKLNPTRIQKTSAFISKAAPIYETYTKLNKLSNGTMTTSLNQLANLMMGANPKSMGGKHRGPTAAQVAAAAAAAANKKNKKGTP